MLTLLLLSLALQSDAPVCAGTNDERNCRSSDGSTYIERRLVDQVVRQGTARDGSTWTEYLTRVFDGTRLEGSDSNGHRWYQQCNPRYGTTGTDRNGNDVFIPPQPRTALAAQSATRSEPVNNPISAPVDADKNTDEGC